MMTRPPISSRARPVRPNRGASFAHPNELDWHRIARSLAQRVRYRYVSPQVEREPQGYRIVSPCCSRNVDASGGNIDIARLDYDDAQGLWRLYSKDHAGRCWELRAQGRLHELLVLLNEDPQRVFWQ
jgi:hypothetical protein